MKSNAEKKARNDENIQQIQLPALLKRARKAYDGDSNDAEHDAMYALLQHFVDLDLTIGCYVRGRLLEAQRLLLGASRFSDGALPGLPGGLEITFHLGQTRVQVRIVA